MKFKRYPIGYFHMDIAELRTGEGKLHLFVAIPCPTAHLQSKCRERDRTSKFAFVQLEERATSMSARAFLEALIEAVPYRIHTILTPFHRLQANDCRAMDNGIQFTN